MGGLYREENPFFLGNIDELTELKIPEGIIVIGNGAFQNFTKLEKVVVGKSVNTILFDAFKGCKKLKDVNLPNGLLNNIGIIQIDTYAFDSTEMLEIKQQEGYDPFAKLESIGVAAFNRAGDNIEISQIPETLKSIASFAFYGCGKYSVINIILPDSLTGFEDNCFSGYADGNINTITHVSGETVDSKELSRLGLSNPTTIEQVIE